MDKPPKKFKASLIVVLIALIPAICYFQSLRNGFVSDDEFTVVKNQAVNGQANVLKVFTSRFIDYSVMPGVYYRPLTTFTFWLDYRIWGAKAFGFHLTNIILHTLCSLLVYFIIRRWSASGLAGAVAGLLFAAHPAHTQSVCWISGRTDVVCTLFGLLAFHIYLRGRDKDSRPDWKVVLASGLCFALALFAKELAAMIPLIILLAEILRPGAPKFRIDAYRLILYPVFFLGLALNLLARFMVMGLPFGYSEIHHQAWYAFGQTDVSWLATVFKIFYYYLTTLFYPVNLSFEAKLYPSISWLDPIVPWSIFLVCAALALAVFCLRHLPGAALGVFWFFLALLPVANIFPIWEIAMEHFLYLPAAGFCLAIASAVSAISAGLSAQKVKWGNGAIIFVLCSIMVCYVSITLERNPVFKDNFTLWSDAVSKAPAKSRAQYDLGNEQFARGETQNAIRSWKRALLAYPNNYGAYYNLGSAYYSLGQFDKSIDAFRQAIRIQPDFPDALNSLGTVLEKQGDLEGAAQSYRTALQMVPQSPVLLGNLVHVYLRLGRCQEIWQMRKLLEQNQPKDVLQTLGEVCPPSK